MIVVDTDSLDLDAAATSNPAPALNGDNLAYMIYTSGSTGRPKGALNTHRAITNRILWMQHAYALGADDTVLQKTPFSFDVSVWELFWPLVTGARLVFARPGGQRETDYLVEPSSANGSPRSISCRRCCVRSSIIPTSTRTAHRCAASYAAAKRCPTTCSSVASSVWTSSCTTSMARPRPPST